MYYIILPCRALPHALPYRIALPYIVLSCLVFSLPFLLALLYYYMVLLLLFYVFYYIIFPCRSLSHALPCPMPCLALPCPMPCLAV
jgi:hypothetical protein